MTYAFISVAAIAWLCQLILGGWQIYLFNRAFSRLCQQGRVGVGRAGGYFRARVVIALAFDNQDRVCDTLIMRGLTVFARPGKINALKGAALRELKPDVIFPADPVCQNALSLALKLKY